MPLKTTWLGRNDIERIADVRMRCYGTGPADRDLFIQRTINDRFVDGDVLVVSDDTGDVATATSLSLTTNVRGGDLPCQGVAWVGTVRSHRRRRIDGRGLASRVMDLLAEKARERGQAVGMLAPFRVSFYESFGYGVVERQHTWTVPLDLLPDGDTGGFSEFDEARDFDAALACRGRQFAQTHGDVATDAGGLKHWLAVLAGAGFRMVDWQGDSAGGRRITGQFTLGTEVEEGRKIAVVHRPIWDSPAALQRLLAMLGTLRDQYSACRITLPIDVPLNWLLRERQVPHRPVDHSASKCQVITRMQAAVIDVPAVVAALRPAAGVAGVVTVGVAPVGRSTPLGGGGWRIEIADGRATATATNSPADVTTDATTFPAVVLGDLPVKAAADIGRLTATRPHSLELLSALTAGPVPYCHEYF